MDWKGFSVLETYTRERSGEFGEILKSRKEILENLAATIQGHLAKHGRALVMFICTHNSRRSQMGQLWGQLAAGYYGIKNIFCFSGGTEASSFSQQAIEALSEAGMHIKRKFPGANPVYRVLLPWMEAEMMAFSKKYTDPPNPTSAFIAVMTCDDASEACPVVHGADARISLTYEDPKSSDGTPAAQKTYAERCKQISREMLFLFSLVANRG